MQESGIHQHPGTRRQESDGPFFGSFVIKACILTVDALTVSLRRRALAQCKVKTTLGGIIIVDTTQSFDAQRIPSPLPSGGLELISSPFGDKTGCILVKTD